MSSEIKVSSVKAKDGTAGISIADSTGNVSLSGTLSAGNLGPNVTGTGLIQTATQFYLNADVTDANPIPSSKWTNANTLATHGSIGAQVTCGDGTGGTTDGYFIFPSTGIYLTGFSITIQNDSSDTYADFNLFYYDNSASTSIAIANYYQFTSGQKKSESHMHIIDITDVNDNIYYKTSSFAGTSKVFGGGAGNLYSTIYFMKIGPT
tara:strand:+ start:1036 stop:1656 length:621 start_codon:yes stop_codon:yes gene_type:complete